MTAPTPPGREAFPRYQSRLFGAGMYAAFYISKRLYNCPAASGKKRGCRIYRSLCKAGCLASPGCGVRIRSDKKTTSRGASHPSGFTLEHPATGCIHSGTKQGRSARLHFPGSKSLSKSTQTLTALQIPGVLRAQRALAM